MRCRILQIGRRVHRSEAADEIVPEENFQMFQAIIATVHKPYPGENQRGLYEQSEIQFPSKKFAPTLLPNAQRENGQCRHHPGDRALAQEPEGQCGVH